MPLTDRVRDLLRCPCCGGRLCHSAELLECVNSDCASEFPVLNGVPILLNEANGLFDLQDNRKRLARRPNWRESIKNLVKRVVPNLTVNVRAGRNFRRLAKLLEDVGPDPLVLLIGAGTLGDGTGELKSNRRLELLETDVVVEERTQLACDAHFLPFANESFDCVVIQAVMEYLQDPFQCVSEIHRVLKRDGLVYSEAPFLLPVHGRDHDFMRFTQVGHRRLYCHFSEISSGVCGGPASTLACSIQYFALSCIPLSQLRNSIKALVRFLLFWLKYLDYVLADTKAGGDAAAGTYFLGKKSDRVRSDREILLVYRGAGTVDGIFHR